jgi:phosphonoacetate hydrolase
MELKMTKPQRVVLAMMDGFGMDYLESTSMPNLEKMIENGFFKEVGGVFPSVTNVNNVSIACSAWPEQHGIVANSFFNETSGQPEYMNAAELIEWPTVFKRAADQGLKSALLTSKKKTLELFHRDVEVGIAAEAAPAEIVKKYGQPGDIYSREINYWLWSVAVDLLQNRPDIQLIYVHTTDYPMHAWAPEARESREHLERLDQLFGAARDADPEAMFLLTADHAMNKKTKCWDLKKVCAEKGTPVRFVLSPERDYYIVHHRNFTGCSWIWLNSPTDRVAVEETLLALDGVTEVRSREEVADKYHLRADRIGDLTVFGDKDTMFGEMDVAYEDLAEDYRAHGSLHEMRLPLLLFNVKQAVPRSEAFAFNKDLAHFLYGQQRDQ